MLTYSKVGFSTFMSEVYLFQRRKSDGEAGTDVVPEK